ncbi:DnaD domain protein [Limosilactobacillus mucosae]|uniref:DnaD domain protein n=1 Tax=Limosilactobacillus mucosae TaxID=97478 RepID=A0AAJ1MAM9_LIMMU|nr:DnaD domain protein [Limosilactobacillus mucosae]MDC2829930.1 DnaD domain protein [Limosilactobacillus mucosae]MDC2837387.1 DnaD domain protein [Limosilactobacillus mucosae]MDC2848734.1 DnaD domain protein [Limosilactobacillus mucosae]MDC2853654.1 DnaD domain protein [Limosilactobacillus mucosae]
MGKRVVNDNRRGFKGVWIPAEYWLDANLTMSEINMITEIDSLDNGNGCYASNKHFAEFFGVTKGRASQIIASLKAKGYISISYDRDGKQITRRVIRVVNKLNRGIKNTKPPIKNTKQGYLENCEERNTELGIHLGERERIKQPLDTNTDLSFLSWPDSLGAMTDQISKLLLDASDQGMSIDLLQKAVDITKYADPGTPYGYLKSVVSDWLSQGIYTMQDWQQHQQKKQAAKHRGIPDIPIYKI